MLTFLHAVSEDGTSARGTEQASVFNYPISSIKYNVMASHPEQNGKWLS